MISRAHRICVPILCPHEKVDLSKTESQAMLLLIPDKVQVQLPPNDVIVFPRVDEATIRDDAWQMRRGGDDGLQAMRTDSGDTVFVLNGGKAQVVLYGRSEDSSSDSEGQAVSPVASWAEMASDGGSSSGAAVAVLPNGAFQVKGPMLGPFNAIMILPDGTFAASTRSAAQGGKEVAEGLAPGTTAAAPIATTGIPTVEAAERAQARFKGLRKRTQEQLGKAREATAIAELHIAKVKSLRVAAEGMSATALAKLAANVEKGGPEIGMVVLEDGSKVAIPEPGKVKAVVLSDSQGQIIFDAETRVIWMPAGGSDNDGGNGGGGGGAKVSESSSSMQCILDDTSATLIQMGDATKTATTVFQNGDKQVQTEAKETMSRRAFESTIKLGANQVSGMVQQPTIDDIFGNPIDNGAPAQVNANRLERLQEQAKTRQMKRNKRRNRANRYGGSCD